MLQHTQTMMDARAVDSLKVVIYISRDIMSRLTGPRRTFQLRLRQAYKGARGASAFSLLVGFLVISPRAANRTVLGVATLQATWCSHRQRDSFTEISRLNQFCSQIWTLATPEFQGKEHWRTILWIHHLLLPLLSTHLRKANWTTAYALLVFSRLLIVVMKCSIKVDHTRSNASAKISISFQTAYTNDVYQTF